MRIGRMVIAAVGAGIFAFVGFGLSRLKVTPASVDASGILLGTARKCVLPHDLFGAAIPSTLNNGLCVERPTHAEANSTKGLFKLSPDGEDAVRVDVKFGRASAHAIEVLDGLKEGDRIITCDMSAWDQLDRIRLR